MTATRVAVREVVRSCARFVTVDPHHHLWADGMGWARKFTPTDVQDPAGVFVRLDPQGAPPGEAQAVAAYLRARGARVQVMAPRRAAMGPTSAPEAAQGGTAPTLRQAVLEAARAVPCGDPPRALAWVERVCDEVGL